MLATFSAPGGGALWEATLFFVALVFSFDFFAPRTDGVPHFGPPSGLDFGGFWSNFGSMLGPSWRYLGALGHKRWHWMGWWGYAKRKELLENRRLTRDSQVSVVLLAIPGIVVSLEIPVFQIFLVKN